jgi:PAS domain S-box-containing protein
VRGSALHKVECALISEARKLGIDVLGAVPWGTHICHFYHTKKDLIDTLVPYFQAGLENNEFCIWITAKPLSKKEAEAAMRKAVPNFSQYLAKQQMEIIPHTEWYLQDGTYNRKRVLNTWADKLMQALASGYDGLRATGDTAWVERKDWHKLIGYEEQVNTVVGNYRILAICTYPLRKYGASQVVDIINNHHYNLIKHRGELSLVGCSEYHQMEEELWEIEDKYRLLLDNSSSAISYWDTEGKIIFTNKQGAKNNGLEEKDLLGKSLYELQPKVADFHMQRLAEIMKEGKGGRFEDKFELPDGERWFSSLFQPIIDRNGKTVGVQIISDDITELKWAEEKKDTVRKTALDGFWVINLEGRFLEVNDSYCQISGYTREELLKMSI